MELLLAFAPPLLAVLLTFFLSRTSKKRQQNPVDTTTEFKITISRRSHLDGQP